MPKKISIKGARVNNLKNISVEIPRDKLVVITGLSGSGKSSLAFDTIYAEGQRRYVESLSTYARQFLGLMDKPDVDSIEGLSPAISIDQRATVTNPRSTVGTMTEIYDYFRLLFARTGRRHCHRCGVIVTKHTSRDIIAAISALSDSMVDICAPIMTGAADGDGKARSTAAILADIQRSGFKKIRIAGVAYDISHAPALTEQPTRIDVVIGSICLHGAGAASLQDLTTLIELALDFGNGQVIVFGEDNLEHRFSHYYYCPACDVTMAAIEPRNFSFNSPAGACPTCAGLGTILEVDPELIIPNAKLTLAQGAIKPWARTFSPQSTYWQLLEVVGKAHDFTLHQSIEGLSAAQYKIVMRGTDSTTYDIDNESMTFPGVVALLQQKYVNSTSEYLRSEIEQYMRVFVCPICQGQRLKSEALTVTLGGKHIAAVAALTIREVRDYCMTLLHDEKSSEKLTARDHKIADRPLREVVSRLDYLVDVGLGYLTLDRAAVTLAGGEAQRIRLATQLGLGLSGIIYILDEPSIGLHQRDNQKLITTLQRLRDIGNTVIVVEHDKMTMEAADELIDIGPGAGEMGGEIIAQGTPQQVMKNKQSLTGKYLAGTATIEAPEKYRKGNGTFLEIIGATAFNLKNVDVKIPLGTFVCLSGVSGSGKSTLLDDILVRALAQKLYRAKAVPGAHKAIKGIEHIDKVIAIDQSPIGRTPRSNPATYTGLFTYIRDLFAETKEAKVRGYGVGKFSFNAQEGRCQTCGGEGLVRIEMQFLSDVYIQCEECHGRRYAPEVLAIHYQGKSIADVLAMSVEEAMKFFRQEQIIYTKLKTLHDVGLGYIKLGQSATTLSGGEAQRIKLATELSRRSTGKTLYVLDEPTTGLHFEDINRLLAVLQKLVDKGNTVLVIEHNLDVIKCVDWVIDMGPEGGAAGGYIVAQGTPSQIAASAKSVTGKYLKLELK